MRYPPDQQKEILAGFGQIPKKISEHKTALYKWTKNVSFLTALDENLQFFDLAST